MDVLRELEVKNKEIFLNKLNIDLDNNHEVLLITCENLSNLFIEEITSKILDIECSTKNKDNVLNSVNNFQQILLIKIKELLDVRYQNIKKILPKIENNYQEVLNKEKEDIINKIGSCYQDNVVSLIKNISIKYSEFDKNRLIIYLNEINYEKYIGKLTEVFNNSNIILLNTYKESLDKYHDLNAKTIK